MKVIFVQNY